MLDIRVLLHSYAYVHGGAYVFHNFFTIFIIHIGKNLYDSMHTHISTHARPPLHTYTYSVAFIYYDNSYDDMISNIIAAFIIRMNIHTITLQLF